MDARRVIKTARAAGNEEGEGAACRAVDEVKRALGEHGPIWWADGAPDLNRMMATNTIYADWYLAQTEE